MAFSSQKNHKKFAPDVEFVLLGVFADAPRNKVPYNVCINALSVIFNYGYNKVQSLKDNMRNVGIRNMGWSIKHQTGY